MTKKAVLFDLDNMLYDYDIHEDSPHYRALRKAHDVLNSFVETDYGEFISLYEISRTEIHRELA
ncbi:MAG: hypothetical protein QMD85_05745 [Candidatus Aenigmarchaeota archaeon]|nr:hypothetical protein [Candidatus Aenigmarchaeota archaeon]